MWKAIINWINSKAYRCEHNWKLMNETEFYNYSSDSMPHKRVFTYRCTKCCEFKSKTI